uniref:Uncharacterized protein n=1 Tax=Rhizophora mucronata TaxID=61149 RepID=A0A2P2P169_RHIMU
MITVLLRLDFAGASSKFPFGRSPSRLPGGRVVAEREP